MSNSQQRSMPTQFNVIVASYNQARFLRDAVSSIFGQSLQDLEVIIVDDGSTDGTLALIDELQMEHPGRIEAVFHKGQQNQGLVRTYQLGISRCTADYLAFLEPDDLWGPRYLETKAAIFRNNPEVDVVFSPYRILREGRWGREMMLRQWILHRRLAKEQRFDNFGNLLRKNNIATFSSFAVRRSMMLDIPEIYDQRALFFDWWMLLCLSSSGLFHMDTQSHVVWRQHNRSALRERSFQAHKQEVIDFYVNAYRYFQEKFEALNAPRQEHFLREFEKLPLFIDFYRSPNFKRFSALFRRDPIWALDSLASYIVNSHKHGS